MQLLTLDDWQREMQRTYKPTNLLNHILGLCGEVGEVAELIKKDLYHSRPIPEGKMLDELGDVLWYLTALATDFDLNLSDIAQHNIDKLRARYPDGFVQGGGIR